VLDLSILLRLLGLKEDVLPSPYREAMEIGDSRITSQFIERFFFVLQSTVVADRTSAFDDLIQELTALVGELSMPSAR